MVVLILHLGHQGGGSTGGHGIAGLHVRLCEPVVKGVLACPCDSHGCLVKTFGILGPAMLGGYHHWGVSS